MERVNAQNAPSAPSPRALSPSDSTPLQARASLRVPTPFSAAAVSAGGGGEDPDVTAHSSTKCCPSQSTAYVSMLPFAYTNNDVAQLFAPFGKLARVTVLRDRQSRQSRGVAFVQFAKTDDCARAVEKMHNTQLEGMTLACSLSRDNGRSQEFIKKRKYAQVKRCFECGDHGHFSYDCPRNVLGAREKPIASGKRKLKKKKKFDPNERVHYFNDEGATNLLAPPSDSEMDVSISLLAYPPPAATIPFQEGSAAANSNAAKVSGRRMRKAGSYFSDEDASDDDDDD